MKSIRAEKYDDNVYEKEEKREYEKSTRLKVTPETFVVPIESVSWNRKLLTSGQTCTMQDGALDRYQRHKFVFIFVYVICLYMCWYVFDREIVGVDEALRHQRT